ncbi:MAG TPA: PAS domain-containing protein [Bacillota bacterium]|nr:PAS domain-containing protein [Bacillota bacterium]
MIDGAGKLLRQTSMTQGLILFEVVCDSSGQLVDLRFLESNRDLTEFNEPLPETILGQTIHEVLPGIEADWFRAFDQLVRTGIPLNFEKYCAILGKWYQVYAFVTKPGRLAVVYHQLNYNLLKAGGFLAGRRTAEEPGDKAEGLNPVVETINQPHQTEILDQANLLTHVNDANIAYDPEVRVSSWNPAAERMYVPDITERKQAQEVFQQSQIQVTQIMESLQDRDFCLRLALEAGEMGWFDYRPLTNELIHDQTCGAIWGLGPEEHQDMDFFWSSLNPEDIAPIRAAMDAAFDPIRYLPFQVEYRIRPADGSPERWVRAIGKTIFEGEGESRRAVRQTGTLQDITERKQAETRINHQNAVLEGINRILREALECDSEADLSQVCLAVALEMTLSKFGFIGDFTPEGLLEGFVCLPPTRLRIYLIIKAFIANELTNRKLAELIAGRFFKEPPS